jgi:hypothetical protein
MVVLYSRNKCLTPPPNLLQWLHIDKEIKMKTAMLGLLITFGAVGGIELAPTTLELVQSSALACVGLALMAIGVSMENSNG